jgi:hypothetical protein
MPNVSRLCLSYINLLKSVCYMYKIYEFSYMYDA